MIRKSALCLLFSLAALSSSHATISFLIDGDLLKNATGSAAMPQSGLFMLVSSTTNATFEGIVGNSSTAVGSLLNGDDKVLFRGDISAFGVDGVLSAATPGLALDSGLLTGWTTGDPLALLWFPTLTAASGTLADGTAYGLYTNAAAVDGSSAWVTPTDPTTNYKLLFYNKDGSELSPGPSASNAGSTGNASLVVGVPEVGRSLLGLMGLGMLSLRRRRR